MYNKSLDWEIDPKMADELIKGIRNIFNIDMNTLSNDDSRIIEEFEIKEKRIKLINKLSKLLQSRRYKYCLPDLYKLYRSIRCFVQQNWPGSDVYIPALNEPELLKECREKRRGLDVTIYYPRGAMKELILTVQGIAPMHYDTIEHTWHAV